MWLSGEFTSFSFWKVYISKPLDEDKSLKKLTKHQQIDEIPIGNPTMKW